MKTPLHYRALEWAVLLIALAIMLFPIYWMVNTALKPAAEVFQSPPTFVSANWSLDAFRSLFESRPIGRYFLNSFVVAAGTKLGDVDPRGAAVDPTRISDKARAIAAGVLEAVLVHGGR